MTIVQQDARAESSSHGRGDVPARAALASLKAIAASCRAQSARESHERTSALRSSHSQSAANSHVRHFHLRDQTETSPLTTHVSLMLTPRGSRSDRQN